ncbi:MAG: hypothetical protein DDT26_00222 [Dehalococcoidia bacterium]|nr:hypothetical protein [Chloroflexota bacterium]
MQSKHYRQGQQVLVGGQLAIAIGQVLHTTKGEYGEFRLNANHLRIVVPLKQVKLCAT